MMRQFHFLHSNDSPKWHSVLTTLMFVARILISANTLVRLVNGNSRTLHAESEKSDGKKYLFGFFFLFFLQTPDTNWIGYRRLFGKICRHWLLAGIKSIVPCQKMWRICFGNFYNWICALWPRARVDVYHSIMAKRQIKELRYTQ